MRLFFYIVDNSAGIACYWPVVMSADVIYLDFAGAGLYTDQQVDDHSQRLRSRVLCNPVDTSYHKNAVSMNWFLSIPVASSEHIWMTISTLSEKRYFISLARIPLNMFLCSHLVCWFGAAYLKTEIPQQERRRHWNLLARRLIGVHNRALSIHVWMINIYFVRL